MHLIMYNIKSAKSMALIISSTKSPPDLAKGIYSYTHHNYRLTLSFIFFVKANMFFPVENITNNL